MTDEAIIEVIAHRMEEECGWSQASAVFNHYSWVDVATHLFCEKGLRESLLYAYAEDIVRAKTMKLDAALRERYTDWQADVATRGGT